MYVCVSMCMCVYTHTTFFFIHSSIDKHLGCFHNLGYWRKYWGEQDGADIFFFQVGIFVYSG